MVENKDRSSFDINQVINMFNLCSHQRNETKRGKEGQLGSLIEFC